MILRSTDTIQIDGIHPLNPITDVVIDDLMQVFTVTRDQDGDTIDPDALWPWCQEREPIAMARLRRLNFRDV